MTDTRLPSDSDILAALRCDHWQTLDGWLAHGLSVDHAVQWSGQTVRLFDMALRYCAERCSLLLIDRGAALVVEQAPVVRNDRPGLLAAACWSDAVLERLLRRGLQVPDDGLMRHDLFDCGAWKGSAASYLRIIGACFAARYCSDKDKDIARGSAAFYWRADLLDALAGLGLALYTRSSTNSTLLHDAVLGRTYDADGNLELLHDTIDYLLSAGVPLDAQDDSGDTPLFDAVRKGRVDVAKALLARGADPFLRNVDHLAAVDKAAERADFAMLTMLRDAGVDLRRPGYSGTTLLHRAAAGPWSSFGNSRLPADYDQVISLLLDCGLSLEAVDERGRTPLLATAVAGSPERLLLLLERGANLQARDLAGLDVHGCIDLAAASPIITQDHAQAMHAAVYSWASRQTLAQLAAGATS